ncbi:MAG: hypothetical protein JJ879_13115, partial [Sneathiella sp.]|nr:hypothetical protein [Sneathiella sp.]
MAKENNSKQNVSVETLSDTVSVEPGTNVQLPFASSAEVILTQDAGNLVVTPLGGDQQITLENFFISEEGSPASSIEFGETGTILTVEEIIANLEEFNPDAIAPAAGPAAGGATGGGAGFNRYNDDGIGDGIGIGDLLPPTELEFEVDTPPEFLVGEEDDPANGTITTTVTTTVGEDETGALITVSGGFEDWNPNIHPTGDDSASGNWPMQVNIDFAPADNEVLNSVTISGIPAGAEFYAGDVANGPAQIIDGSVTVPLIDGQLPNMWIKPVSDSDVDFDLSIEASISDPDGGTSGVAVSASFEGQTTSGGNSFALGTGGSVVSQGAIENLLGLQTGSLDNMSNGNATEGSAAALSFTSAGGGEISFDWNFLTSESTPATFNDFAFLTIDGQVFELADTGSGFIASSTSFNEETGVATTTISFGAGEHVIGFGVVDEGDALVDSGLTVENIEIFQYNTNGIASDTVTVIVDAVADEAEIDFSGALSEGSVANWIYNEDNAEPSDQQNTPELGCYLDGAPVYKIGFEASVDDRDGSESITKITLTPGVGESGFDADDNGAMMSWVLVDGISASPIDENTEFSANVEGVGWTTVTATSVSIGVDGSLELTFDASLDILDLDLTDLGIQLPQHSDDDVSLNLAVEVTDTPTDSEAQYAAPGGSIGGVDDDNNDGIVDENNVSVKEATLNLNVDAVADTPVLSVTAGETNENEPITLDVSASFPDTDGSETHTLTVDLPDGWEMIPDENETTSNGWVDNGDGSLSYTVEGGNYNGGPVVQPPAEYFGEASLQVTATATETDPEGNVTHTECSVNADIVITDSAIVTVGETSVGSLNVVEQPGDGSHQMSFDITLAEQNNSGDTIRVYFTLGGD